MALEQHSFRLQFTVQADGSVDLGEVPPFHGRLDLRPILSAEAITPSGIEMVLHWGRLYLWAEGFRNVWEASPRPGTSRAGFRPLPISDHPVSGLRFAHYGPAGAACLRLDIPGDVTRFITPEGGLHEECS